MWRIIPYLPELRSEIFHYDFPHVTKYVLCFRELQLLRFHSNYLLKMFNKKQLFLNILNGYFEIAYGGSAQIVFTAVFFGPCQTYMVYSSCIINQRLVVNTFHMLPNVEEGRFDIYAPFTQETYYPDCTFLLTCSIDTFAITPINLMPPHLAFTCAKLTVHISHLVLVFILLTLNT